MELLSTAYEAIAKVSATMGDRSSIRRGGDTSLREWRALLTKIGDDLNFWGRTFSRTVESEPDVFEEVEEQAA